MRNARNKVDQNMVDNIMMTTIMMETETAVTISTETETAVVGCHKGSNNSNNKKLVTIRYYLGVTTSPHQQQCQKLQF